MVSAGKTSLSAALGLEPRGVDKEHGWSGGTNGGPELRAYIAL